MDVVQDAPLGGMPGQVPSQVGVGRDAGVVGDQFGESGGQLAVDLRVPVVPGRPGHAAPPRSSQSVSASRRASARVSWAGR